MAWVLIRYRLLAVWNTIRFSTPRQRVVSLALSAVSLALALGVYAGFRLIMAVRGTGAAGEALTYEMVYAVFLFMTAGSVPFLAATLLHPGDVSLLGAAPINARHIILVRMIEGAAAGAAQFAPIGAPAILACAAGLGYGWRELPVVVWAGFALVALPAVITAALLAAAVAVLGHQRVRSAVALVNVLLGSLVCLTAVSQVTGLRVQEGLAGMVAGSPNPSGRLPYLAPWAWIAEVMVGVGTGDWMLAASASVRMALAIALLTPLSVGLGASLFQTGRISGADEVGASARSRAVSGRSPEQRIMISGPLAGMVRKELRCILRDSLLLSQIGMPAILYLVPFVMAANPAFRTHARGDELFAFGFLMVLAVLYMQSSILSLSSLGLDGRAFWIVLISPGLLRKTLFAKWLVCWGLSSAMGSAMVVLSGAAFMAEWTTVAVLAAVVVMSAAGLCGIGVGLAATFPRLVFDNPAHRVSPIAIVLGFGAGMAHAGVSWGILGATWYATTHWPAHAWSIAVAGLSVALIGAGLAVCAPLIIGHHRLTRFEWEY